MEKICKSCKISKPLEQYHRHKDCKHGCVATCKTCMNAKVMVRYHLLMRSPEFAEQERIRARDKYRRFQYRPDPKKKHADDILYRKKYPEKYHAKFAIRNKNLKPKRGCHLHHWSYLKQHYLDVIELPGGLHVSMHRFLVYDQSEMKYRIKVSNELLDTKEKHINFIETVISNLN